MSNQPDVDDLDLTDAELMTVLKNHGIGRRRLMQIFGAGAVVAAFGGTASAERGTGNHIDETFGASYAADDTVPSGTVDHVVELHVHEHGDGAHEGFPAPDDSRDADPMTPGFQADEDDFDDFPEFHFEPVGLHVRPGDVVEFRNVSTEHTVSAFHPKWSNPEISFPQRVPDRVPGFTSPPYVGEESWLYRFTEKGVYDVFCFPHLTLGMVMRIVVSDPEEDDLSDEKFSDYPDLMHPAFRNSNRVLNAPELDPPAELVNGQGGSVAWEDLSLGPLPASLPRPSVDTLSVSEGSHSDFDAEVDVDWAVSDPTGDLATVRMTLTDVQDGRTEDVACHTVSGGSDSGRDQLVATEDDDTGRQFRVEFVVTNHGGLSVTETATVTAS